MSFLNTVLVKLNSDQSVSVSGFMIGFLYDFKFNRRTLHFPLSTIFNSAIAGFFTAIGAKIVSGFIPSNLKFIIPLMAIASCFYYKYIDMFGEKPNNKTITKNNNKTEDKKVNE